MSTSEQNKAIVLRWLSEMDQKNWSIFEELVDDNYVFNMPGNPVPMTRDQHVETTQTFYKAFPDLVHHVKDTIAENDRVVVRMRVTGTQKEEFFGTPASGNSVDVGSILIGRLEGGKVVEVWGEFDFAGLMQQISTAETVAA